MMTSSGVATVQKPLCTAQAYSKGISIAHLENQSRIYFLVNRPTDDLPKHQQITNKEFLASYIVFMGASDSGRYTGTKQLQGQKAEVTGATWAQLA